MRTRLGTCTTCGYHGLTQAKGPNHILHIILAILTAGWWLIAYAFAAIMASRDSRFTCMSCGQQTVKLGAPTTPQPG